MGEVEDIKTTFLEPTSGIFWVKCIYGRNDDAARFGFFCGAALEYLRHHCEHMWAHPPLLWHHAWCHLQPSSLCQVMTVLLGSQAAPLLINSQPVHSVLHAAHAAELCWRTTIDLRRSFLASICHCLLMLKSAACRPDMVHAHDWPTAPVAFGDLGGRCRSIFTIHNLNYGADLIGRAMLAAAAGTTVSPTYAAEVRLPASCTGGPQSALTHRTAD